jgi:predicted Rdx family selenoprotein
VAALIKEKLNHDVTLEPGGRGEFSVSVDGKKVAEKSRTGFPGELTIIELVRAALE